MPDKLLLCVSANQTVAAHWRGGRVVQCAAFGSDESGLGEFSAFVSPLRTAHVWIAADTVEEDYRFESLPHATGSDRAEMLSRKLKQYYRNTPYVSAVAQGREGGKRRDDRFLFSALTNPALIDPWLRILDARGHHVAGICLVSDLTPALLRALKLDAPNVLVAARHHAGLRLTVYRRGEFCLSRLTRGDPSANADLARLFAEEISNTRLYLSSLLPESLDEPLTAVFLDHDDSLAEVTQHVADENPGMSCLRASRAGLTSQLPIEAAYLDIALETIYLRLLAAEAPANNLAPAPLTANYRRQRTAQALYIASAGVFAAGMITGAYNLWQAHDLRREAAEAARQTTLAQAQYREITRTFPAAPASSEQLRKAVEIHSKLLKTRRTPEQLLNLLARALEPSPEISVMEVSWRHGVEPVEGGAPAPRPPGSAATANIRHQGGYLSGEIRPFSGDYRAAIESVNRLAGRLSKDPAVAHVEILKLPLNVNPGLALAGNTTDAPEQTGRAEFRLAIAMKPGV